MKNNEDELCVHKLQDNACLSIIIVTLTDFFCSFLKKNVVHTAAQASTAVHVLSGKHKEDKTVQEHYPMFK